MGPPMRMSRYDTISINRKVGFRITGVATAFPGSTDTRVRARSYFGARALRREKGVSGVERRSAGRDTELARGSCAGAGAGAGQGEKPGKIRRGLGLRRQAGGACTEARADQEEKGSGRSSRLEALRADGATSAPVAQRRSARQAAR